MSETTNWGIVSQSIVTKLTELVTVGGLVKLVQAATEEDLAAWAPKGFPAIAVVWKGATIQKDVTLLAGRFAVLERGRWEVHHFTSTGRTDATGLFSIDGPFYVELASHEKLFGFSPEGQVNNSFLLHTDGRGEIEKFTARGGSGGMKIVVPYWLDQMVTAVGA